MTREEVRRTNARKLSAIVGGPTEFGRKLVMEGSQVSQLIGPNPTKNIGNSIAKRIEGAFGFPTGWLDVEHPELGNDALEEISVQQYSDQAAREAVLKVEQPIAKYEVSSRASPPSHLTGTPKVILANDEEIALLDLYRRSTIRGRQEAMNTLLSTEKLPLAEVLSGS